MKDANQKPIQFQAKISEEVADGIYSNVASIMHNNNEFIMDFGRIVPGKASFNVLSRIISTPANAKRLLNALRGNIEQFESKFGEIKLENEDPSRKVGF